MKKYIIINILIFITITVAGQYDPQYSLNLYNNMAINPGYAGSNDAICANAIIRNQWMGFGDGAPTTQMFSINSPFRLFNHNHGAGLTIINDKIGFNNTIGLNLAYAYRYAVGQGMLGIGLDIGFLNYTIEPTWIKPDESMIDDYIPTTDDKPMALDFGVGAFYKTDNFYIGVSSKHLSQTKFEFVKGTSFIKRHYYITSGYNYQLTNPLFEIRPSVFIKTDGVSSQLSLNGILLYNKRFWGGVSYRTTDAIAVMFGLEFLGGIKAGLAYDLTTSKIREYDSGSLEIMIGYCFNLKVEKQKQIYKSIRFL